MKTAKSGGYPAFLADLRDDNGAAVPFFGKPALSTVFPALLARKAGLPLYAGAAFREPNVRFVIRARAGGGPRTPTTTRPTRSRDGRAAGAVRGLHPPGARTMDVGPPEMGLAYPVKGSPWPREPPE